MAHGETPFVPLDRAATRADVARLAGVSTAVVSYVINGGPRPVAAATRERVLKSLQTLNYRPNAAARALKLRKVSAVGLVVPDVSNTYFGALARSVSSQAFESGYALLLGDANNSLEREAEQIRSLIGRQVDGLIVVSLSPDADDDIGSTPTVFLDKRVQPGEPSIVVDNYGGATAAVEHLIWHGKKTIGYIGGPVGFPGSDERLNAWRDAVNRARLSESLAHQVRSEFSRRGGYDAAHALLDGSGKRPDAIFVSSDVQALGLLLACRELGVRVPEDLAVVSFDGTDDAVYSDPPLTAVEQPVDTIAAMALQAVLSDGPHEPRTDIPLELVIRRSCGCEGARLAV
jgi:LacI family transcriptional regulator